MKLIGQTLITACAVLALNGAAFADNLEEVYQAALTSDPQLASAEAAYRAAMENAPIARSSLLPQINAQAGYDRIDQQYDSASPVFSDDDFNRTSYGISLSQALFRKDYWAQLAQADAGVAQAEAQILAARQELIVRVADAYFTVLTAEESLALAEAEKNALEQTLAQAKERFDVGLIAITDVRDAQAQYDLSTASEIASRAQLDNARERLRAMVGMLPESLAPLPAELALETPDPADVEAWLKLAQDNNLQVKAAGYGVQVAEKTIDLRQAGHYPTLDLNARYGVQDDTGGFSEGKATSTQIGLGLVVPIYSGNRTSAQVRQAKYQLVQAEKALEQAQRSATLQVRANYLNVLSSISQVEALQQAVLSSETASEAAQAGYEVGTRTSVDVLNALRQIYSAKRDYTNARNQYVLNVLRLKQAAGILTDQDLPTTSPRGS